MTLKDNTSGILLDQSSVRTIEIDLPLLNRQRTYTYMNNETVINDIYGETMFFGDWHLGSSGFSNNSFNAHLTLLKQNPHMRTLLTGDYFEFSGKTNYISDEILDIDDQIDLFVKTLKLLKHQVIGILAGNHDNRITKYTGIKKYLRHYAKEAGIDVDKIYIGDPQRGINIFFSAGDFVYSAYGIHGSTSAWRNKNTQLKRMAVGRRHTLLFMGHVHQILWEPVLYLEPTNKGEVEARLQYWLATGGFLKDASYAEAKSYPPSLVGAPIVRFFANKNELDMWTMPYRSHYIQGGTTPLTGIEGSNFIARKDERKRKQFPVLNTLSEKYTPKSKTSVLPP